MRSLTKTRLSALILIGLLTLVQAPAAYAAGIGNLSVRLTVVGSSAIVFDSNGTGHWVVANGSASELQLAPLTTEKNLRARATPRSDQQAAAASKESVPSVEPTPATETSRAALSLF